MFCGIRGAAFGMNNRIDNSNLRNFRRHTERGGFIPHRRRC